MAIRDLFWACPVCRETGTIRPAGRRERCTGCGTGFRRGAGASIIAEPEEGRSGEATVRTAADWLRLIGEPPAAAVEGDAAILGPEPATACIAHSETPLYQGRELLGWIEQFGERAAGTLTLTAERLRFVPSDPRASGFDWWLAAVTVVQPESSALQVAAGPTSVASLRFPQGSTRHWTRAITTALRSLHADRGRVVTQFMPVIRTAPAGSAEPARTPDPPRRNGGEPRRIDPSRLPPPPPPGPFYWTVHALPRLLWAPLGKLEGIGLEHIPASGPFLLVSNHQSVLDPFMIQTLFRRPCHPMAKSTQFGSPLVAWALRRCYAFPVRRYRVDPQAVRVALRRLAQGHPVHIYIEGERSWDGGLQKPRPGTVRLALRAGVPILPCAIAGAYDVWPRWHRGIRRGTVRVAFGEPFHLPVPRSRAEREARLPEAAERIMGAIRSLLPDGSARSSVEDI